MTLTSSSYRSSSIFENGKLKPGIYKIQNISSETYLDIEVHSREVCCRPLNDLGEGRGLWEIKQFGAGYTLQRVDPGNPEQFCTPLNGVLGGVTLRVTAYPVAWRVDPVDDDNHRGFEYVCFAWATAKIAWDLTGGNKANGAPVQTYPILATGASVRQMWKLIPAKVDSTPMEGILPSYDGNSGGSSTDTQTPGTESDELGTFVNEVTVVNTTVTTRKRYRVEEA